MAFVNKSAWRQMGILPMGILPTMGILPIDKARAQGIACADNLGYPMQ
jgi:hypothetical protein